MRLAFYSYQLRSALGLVTLALAIAPSWSEAKDAIPCGSLYARFRATDDPKEQMALMKAMQSEKAQNETLFAQTQCAVMRLEEARRIQRSRRELYKIRQPIEGALITCAGLRDLLQEKSDQEIDSEQTSFCGPTAGDFESTQSVLTQCTGSVDEIERRLRLEMRLPDATAYLSKLDPQALKCALQSPSRTPVEDCADCGLRVRAVQMKLPPSAQAAMSVAQQVSGGKETKAKESSTVPPALSKTELPRDYATPPPLTEEERAEMKKLFAPDKNSLALLQELKKPAKKVAKLPPLPKPKKQKPKAKPQLAQLPSKKLVIAQLETALKTNPEETPKNLGELTLAGMHYVEPDSKEKQTRAALTQWRENTKEYSDLVSQMPPGPISGHNWTRLMNVALDQGLKDYRREQDNFAAALLGNGGNCDARTWWIASMIASNQIQAPAGYEWGVQLYDDPDPTKPGHIQIVAVNPKTGDTVQALTQKVQTLNGKPGAEANVYSMSILPRVLLGKLKGAKPEFSKKDLLVEVADDIKAIAEVEKKKEAPKETGASGIEFSFGTGIAKTSPKPETPPRQPDSTTTSGSTSSPDSTSSSDGGTQSPAAKKSPAPQAKASTPDAGVSEKATADVKSSAQQRKANIDFLPRATKRRFGGGSGIPPARATTERLIYQGGFEPQSLRENKGHSSGVSSTQTETAWGETTDEQTLPAGNGKDKTQAGINFDALIAAEREAERAGRAFREDLKTLTKDFEPKSLSDRTARALSPEQISWLAERNSAIKDQLEYELKSDYSLLQANPEKFLEFFTLVSLVNGPIFLVSTSEEADQFNDMKSTEKVELLKRRFRDSLSRSYLAEETQALLRFLADPITALQQSQIKPFSSELPIRYDRYRFSTQDSYAPSWARAVYYSGDNAWSSGDEPGSSGPPASELLNHPATAAALKLKADFLRKIYAHPDLFLKAIDQSGNRNAKTAALDAFRSDLHVSGQLDTLGTSKSDPLASTTDLVAVLMEGQNKIKTSSQKRSVTSLKGGRESNSWPTPPAPAKITGYSRELVDLVLVAHLRFLMSCAEGPCSDRASDAAMKTFIDSLPLWEESTRRAFLATNSNRGLDLTNTQILSELQKKSDEIAARFPSEQLIYPAPPRHPPKQFKIPRELAKLFVHFGGWDNAGEAYQQKLRELLQEPLATNP